MNAEFEKYAKDQFDHYEVPVDTKALWAEIAPIVKPKKDNRRFIWFFFGGLLIGGLFIAGLYQTKQNSSANELTLLSEVSEETSPSLIAENIKPAANDPLPAANEFTASNNQTTTTSLATKKQATLYTPRSESLVGTHEGNITTQAARANEQQSASALAHSISPLNASSDWIKADDSDGTPGADLGSGIMEAPGFSLPGENLENQSTEGLNLVKVNREKDDVWDASLKGLPLFAELADDPGFESFYTGMTAPTDVADQRFASEREVLEAVKARMNQEAVSEEATTSENVKKIQKRRSNFLRDVQFGLGIYGGISRSTTELSPRNAQSTEYELLRINSEKQLETLHAGFNALIVSDEKLYLRTGAEYTRIGSLFSQSAERVEVDSIEGIVEIQINEFTGDTTEISGFLTRTLTTRYTKKSYNYFHLVDVPVILGYNFGSENLTIGIEAGIYANILVKNKGEVFQQDESFYDKKADPQGWYKSNIGISPFIGCNVAYHVNENLQFHMSPGFRFPSVFSTEANPLIEKHSNLGVQMGIRYIFDNY